MKINKAKKQEQANQMPNIKKKIRKSIKKRGTTKQKMHLSVNISPAHYIELHQSGLTLRPLTDERNNSDYLFNIQTTAKLPK